MNDRASERVGRVLRDKWRLDTLLGAGGMACVYAATHRNGTRAAVKLLHPELSLNPDIKARFLREGYLANSIDHPGIVRVFDDDTDTDGSVYLVMDLLVGETLDSRWRKANRRLPLEEVLRISTSLLDVLGAAHAKGIVHRDIKPENVFLTQGGGLRVLDFGIARVREVQQENATQTGALLGTPSYMSPEQARGQWEIVDGRTDLWAVGATMFTLLAGRPPHYGGGGNAVLLAAMTQQAPPLASIAPDVPKPVCDIVDRALAFDPNFRWRDARSMQQGLQSVSVMLGFAPTMMLSMQESPRTSALQSGQHMAMPPQPQPTVSGVAQTVSGNHPIPPPPTTRGWIVPVVLGCLIAGGGIVFVMAAVLKSGKTTTASPAPSESIAMTPSAAPSDAQQPAPSSASIAPLVSSTPSVAVAPVIKNPSTTTTTVHHTSSSAVSSAKPTSSSTAVDPHDSRH